MSRVCVASHWVKMRDPMSPGLNHLSLLYIANYVSQFSYVNQILCSDTSLEVDI